MPGENYILLERTELNAAAASVTFANIPQTGYTDLKIVATCRVASGSGNAYGLRFNGDTASNYTAIVLRNNGNVAGSYTTSGTILHEIKVPTASDTANTFSNDEFYIPNYTSSTQKSTSLDNAYDVNTSSYDSPLSLQAGKWSGTVAITSVTIQPTSSWNLAAGSTFSLYGIAALGTTPVIAPKAIGGNIIDYDGTYWIHTFTSSGTFTPLQGLTCDYLVIAGGGGGGCSFGGGGGGGGYLSGSSQSLTVQNYTIAVGAGGNGSTNSSNKGSNGSNSVFSSFTSIGGGGGGSDGNPQGANGGSGGGGDIDATTRGAKTTGQGFDGGLGSRTTFSGGGGGGAGAQGGDSLTAPNRGNGGSGLASTITGTSVSRAGGGGAGISSSIPSSVSVGLGTDGGGNGGATNNSSGSAGTVNTGGGGGGSGQTDTSSSGGAGGSGIVIIRYPAA
jgi:hypothetical protein